MQSEPTREAVEAEVLGSYTPEGAAIWWHRPRRQLSGRTPNQAWEDGDRLSVWYLAESLGGQIAT